MIYKILAFFLIAHDWSGVQEQLNYSDHVYLEHIKSVKFHHEGLPTSSAIIDLNSSGRLLLSFDDILGGDINYQYRIIHCDRDWNPSSLDESEYINGFNDEEIKDFRYSIGTKTGYTHYELRLPGRDISWRYSGNYLLIVKDVDNDELALTRRFMVVDPKVQILGEVKRSLSATKLYTHQELDITLNNKNFNIQNPQRDLSVTIMQNGRWDNIQSGIKPKFSTGYTIQFDRTLLPSFEGLNEFRGLDLRNIRSRGYGVHTIDVTLDRIFVTCELDPSRNGKSYIATNDLNGSFSIEAQEYLNNPDVRPEYLEVIFSLYSRDMIMDGDVYVVGSFSDWQLKPEWKMDYNYSKQIYFTSGLLKQGFYDYQYVLKKDRSPMDLSHFEGSHYETNNQYTILVYYKSFADRYDQLIAVKNLPSGFQ